MSSSPIYFGVDFAKDKFDHHSAAGSGSLPNTPTGQRRFLATLPPGAHVVCESTGSCHRALVAAAHAAGVAVTVANPHQVRCFARGLGRRAKTDPSDAESLYDFGRLTTPKADLAPSVAQTTLRELVVARQQLVLARSALQIQFAGHELPMVKALFRAQRKLLSTQILKLEATIAKTLAAESILATQAARLRAVQGIGAVTAATALALCPELGTLSRGQAAALLGVAPYNDDSGPLDRPATSTTLHYSASAAPLYGPPSAPQNPILRAHYQHLRDAASSNPPNSLAITAIKRQDRSLLLNGHLVKYPSFQLAS